MSNTQPNRPELLQLEAQIADIAKDTIKKIEASVPRPIDRSRVYARLSQAFLEACQGELVDTQQKLQEALRRAE
jgi:hypothetical protein